MQERYVAFHISHAFFRIQNMSVYVNLFLFCVKSTSDVSRPHRSVVYQKTRYLQAYGDNGVAGRFRYAERARCRSGEGHVVKVYKVQDIVYIHLL